MFSLRYGLELYHLEESLVFKRSFYWQRGYVVTGLVIILELHTLNKVGCNDKTGGNIWRVKKGRSEERDVWITVGVKRTLAFMRKNPTLIGIQTGLNNQIWTALRKAVNGIIVTV